MSSVDLTAVARIRQAAVELIGQQGFAQTTIRQVAERAEVSPGLVIHHYGSKGALAQACDDWVLQVTFDEKNAALASAIVSMSGYVNEHPEFQMLSRYLVQRLRHGGEAAQRFFDGLCELTEKLLGNPPFRQFDDARGAAAVLVAFSTGASLLGEQLAHRLGGENIYEPAVFERYGALTVQLLAATMDPDFVSSVLKEQE